MFNCSHVYGNVNLLNSLIFTAFFMLNISLLFSGIFTLFPVSFRISESPF